MSTSTPRPSFSPARRASVRGSFAPRALVGAALTCTSLAASAACDAGTIPAYVTLALRGGLPADGALVSEDGATLRLGTARLTVLAATLESCPASPTAALRALLRPAVARAHSEGSPTRLGEPHVVDLRNDAGTVLGELEPPAGRYCSVRLTLGPADADAVGLPSPDFAGTTFAMTGDVDLPAPRAVSGRSTGNLTTTAALEPALTLGEGDDARIDLVFGDATALSTATLAGLTDDALAGTLLLGAQRASAAAVTR
jgi:hypothetical protein